MAGIYLHIPFCKKACHYCDFHFTTSLKYKDELVLAMLKELELQQSYLGNETIDTIYFGGGTPSLLGASAIQTLIDQITSLYTLNAGAEITLEANPDDLGPMAVSQFRHTQVNRFSIGIQSFYEEDLRWMNRAHNATEAESAVKRVQDAGFDNITVDLIYGYPLLTNVKWEAAIQRVLDFEVNHVSAYAMTVEPRTALASYIKKGSQLDMSDAQSSEQYLLLIEKLEKAGFEHYETSNFAKPQCYSKHNTNYWRGASYLGIGPSAHSFNGETRQWNIANNPRYIESIAGGTIPAEREFLSTENRLNEYIMTSLRTMWGIDLTLIETRFGLSFRHQMEPAISRFQTEGHLIKQGNTLRLSKTGKLFADGIASELFTSN